MIGACTPDLLSVADRAVRLRSKRVLPFIEGSPPDEAEFYRGVLQHLHDDDWFSRHPRLCGSHREVAACFRRAIGGDHPTPCSFLGHVVMEMLLDSVLMEQHPDSVDRFYEALRAIDPRRVEAAVNQCARQPTERLALLIPRFIAERFLDDYATPSGLAWRLNQVLKRSN